MPVRHCYLLLVIPGLIVLSAAVLVFESSHNLSAAGFEKLIESLHSLAASSNTLTATHALIEIRARYIWLTTVIVNLAVPIYAAVLCGLIIYRSHSRQRLLLVAGVGVALCALGLVALAFSAQTKDMLYRAVFAFTFFTLERSQRFDAGFLGRVHTIIVIMNVLAVTVPVIAILAAAGTLAEPEKGQQITPKFFATQMRNLTEVLNAGSALLVSGILHMDAWLRWPASLVLDTRAQDAVQGAALSITLFWGATFTLVLIATYGPAASYLGMQARELLQQNVYRSTYPDPDQWLKERGLSFTLGEQLPQFGVMLAPLLAGPIGSLLMTPITGAR